jgi:ribulose 1,5-bisphosphate carboxylase large subunit-like protein
MSHAHLKVHFPRYAAMYDAYKSARQHGMDAEFLEWFLRELGVDDEQKIFEASVNAAREWDL